MLQPSQLRYHWYVLGSRKALCQHFKVGGDTVSRILPEDDTDRYMRGQAISIGGILVKRCAVCGTARELEQFWMDNARASGCRAKCDTCRGYC